MTFTTSINHSMAKRPARRRLLPAIAFLALTLTGVGSAGPVQTVDLSGAWNFTPFGEAATTIQVPGGGWYKQGFTTVDEADYGKTIAIPDIGQPQVTKIKFGAVNYQADLYVDEVLVGSSTQSHTAATFDLTGHVTPGGSHAVRVHVKGHDALMHNGRSLVPNGARSWADFLPQGIFRSAELLVYPQVHIEDVFVKTSVADTSLSYDVWLRNDSASTASFTLSGNLSSWNGDSWTYPALPSQPVSVPANTTAKITVGPVSWALGSTSYWWPNVPYQAGYSAKLHDLSLSLTDGAAHSTSVRFGFRECTQAPDGQGNTCYFLNGTRVNFRGDSLQGANYDRIDNGGKGDAFSTLPGFLPGPNGWPKAVDHYQRLNYNVVRIHQIPATPYMLDVCDEMGLMIIDETGIRGAGNQQDFVAGHDNMVNHVKQLFTQNRNHASIVRQSLSNEPDWSNSDSTQFEIDLYNAAMEVDGTRPLSVDTGAATYNTMTYPNFSVFRHYGNGGAHGEYTEIVHERPDRPYGCGEFIWDKDNTAQGFAWFATATQAMRAKGASDIRPYTLLSAWASVIPGVNTTDMRLENPPWNSAPLYPLFGENNLPAPWENPIIQRVQAGFHPVLVADSAYWEEVKLSNAGGDWPASNPKIAPSAEITRELAIYNDTFSGTAVDVSWELRHNSTTGVLLDSGVLNATVPLGYRETRNITFSTPDAPEGTIVYLVLSTNKGGVEMFRETEQRFELSAAVPEPVPLVNAGFEQPAVGKITAGFDASGPNDVPGWADVGTPADSGIEAASFAAHGGDYAAYFKGRTSTRNRGASRMTGHTIRAGDVFTLGYWAKVDYQSSANRAHMTGVLFWDVADAPAHEMGFMAANNLSASSWSYHELTVAADDIPASIGRELGVHFVNSNYDWAALDDVTLTVSGVSPDVTPPAGPIDLNATTGDAVVSLDWADSAEADLHSYNIYRSTSLGGPYSPVAPFVASSAYEDHAVVNGTTYYYVVTALDSSSNESGNSNEAPATPLNPGQAWRQLHFESIANTGDAADGADPDSDSLLNLFERAFGGDPKVAEWGLNPEIRISEPNFNFQYRKANSATDLEFEVQESPRMINGSWVAAAGESEVLSDADGIRIVRFTGSADGSKRFMRLKIARP